MSEVKQYAQRDLMGMDFAGNHYCRHVSAMTREQLHSKSDIAAELGWRDMQIAKLTAERDALAAESVGMDKFVDSLLSIAWQGGSSDGADIQELALNHGLIRQESYCADTHESLVEDPGNFEEGDEVYFRVETPATAAYLNAVRAEGVDKAIAHLHKKFEGTGHIGVPVMALESLANQLRAGEPL